MVCARCGKEGPDGAYCTYCGAKQEISRQVRRRANGQGSVYKRGKGYQATVTYYVAGIRKTLNKSGFVSKKAAYAYLPTLLDKMKDRYGKRKNTTLADQYAKWSKTELPRKSQSKQTAYRIAWAKLSKIHNVDLTSLTIADLQQIVDEQAPTYYPARDMKTVLSQLYTRACAEEVVRSNLAKYIVLPSLEEKETEPYSEDELAVMWEAYEKGDMFVGFPLIMIYTGMMPGELIGCRKSMIDLDKQVIVGAGLKTKERRSKPVILPDNIIPVIKAICESHNRKSLIGMNRDKFYEQYHDMAKRLGIRDLNPYSCRHTTATALAVGDKVAPSVITRVMRQKNMATTERYKHADEQIKLEALNTLATGPITGRKEVSKTDE